MSADVLRRLEQEGAISVADLMDLWNLADSSVYPYLSHREMSFGKFRTLFRKSLDERVRRAFLADLLAGTGFIAMPVKPELDINGDGRVNTDDAMGAGIEQIKAGGETLQALHRKLGDKTLTVDEGDLLLERIDDVIGQAVLTRNIVAWLRDQAASRRPAVQRPLGFVHNGGGR